MIPSVFASLNVALPVTLKLPLSVIPPRVAVAPRVPVYTWNEWRISYSGNPSAPFWVSGAYTGGGFYDGDLNRVDVSANARVGAKIQASVGWRRDNVALPGGDFTTDLIPVRFNYSFTPLMNIRALIQYNSQSADISSNIRFAMLSRSGTATRSKLST